MNSRLCSDNFRHFFDKIDKMGLKVDEIAEVISQNIEGIAKDIHLGKLVCKFYTPPTPVERDGKTIEFEFYSDKNGCEQDLIDYIFPTGEGGSVTFFAYPEKAHCWNEYEQEDLLFLCKNVFAICGRSRLSDIIRNSLSRDANTGLFNANGYMASGNYFLQQGKLHQYTAMYLNLKNFRYVNNQAGNRNGDAVIKGFALALMGIVKEDEVAARLGGDNFTLLVKKERRDEVISFLSNIPISIEKNGTNLTFEISTRAGVYDIEPGDTMPHIMNCISAAIGLAKQSTTPDIVIFNKDIVQKISRAHEIAAALPDAIKNREFLVYFQPKVNLETSEICGCEALVRWFRDGKLISPAEFIPVFERDGNICALDFYMLEGVCRHIKEWEELGLEPVPVSVNFSKTHLHNPKIAEEILAVLKKYNVDSKYIEIELTEMSDFSDYNAFKNLVTEMKNNGVLTSIDDFGTGYSSLNLLTDFMFDIVKLDKSFFDNIIKSNSKTDEIVVRNMLRMIKELDMKAIAEGVETPEQARFLKEINCTMVQGYLFDKPLPADEFINRLKTRKYNTVI